MFYNLRYLLWYWIYKFTRCLFVNNSLFEDTNILRFKKKWITVWPLDIRHGYKYLAIVIFESVAAFRIRVWLLFASLTQMERLDPETALRDVTLKRIACKADDVYFVANVDIKTQTCCFLNVDMIWSLFKFDSHILCSVLCYFAEWWIW